MKSNLSLIFKNKQENQIKRNKFEYYQNQINKNAPNTKSISNIVQQISHAKKRKHHVESVVNDNEETLLGKNKMANKFNTVYSEMGKNMADILTRDPYSSSCKPTLSNSIVSLPTDRRELRRVINELNSKKSTGIVGLQVSTIKYIAGFHSGTGTSTDL